MNTTEKQRNTEKDQLYVFSVLLTVGVCAPQEDFVSVSIPGLSRWDDDWQLERDFGILPVSIPGLSRWDDDWQLERDFGILPVSIPGLSRWDDDWQLLGYYD